MDLSQALPDATAESHESGVVVERLIAPSDEDVERIAQLLPQLTDAAALDGPSLCAIAQAPGTLLFVARLDGHLVAMITVLSFQLVTGRRALVEDVVVDDAVRGRGIGAALVEAAIAAAGELGARHVDLTSRPSREAANRLYERCGFVRRETNVWRYLFSSPVPLPPGTGVSALRPE